MALTSARQILNKKILGGSDVQELEVKVAALSASVLSIGEKIENVTEYSTTERVVGKWVDGSDIYEKTYNFGSLPDTNTKIIQHGITDLNKIIELSGYCYGIPSGFDREFYYPLPLVSVSSPISLFATEDDIQIQTASDRTSLSAYVTIKYTKNAASTTKRTTKRNKERK